MRLLSCYSMFFTLQQTLIFTCSMSVCLVRSSQRRCVCLNVEPLVDGLVVVNSALLYVLLYVFVDDVVDCLIMMKLILLVCWFWCISLWYRQGYCSVLSIDVVIFLWHCCQESYVNNPLQKWFKALGPILRRMLQGLLGVSSQASAPRCRRSACCRSWCAPWEDSLRSSRIVNVVIVGVVAFVAQAGLRT